MSVARSLPEPDPLHLQFAFRYAGDRVRDLQRLNGRSLGHLAVKGGTYTLQGIPFPDLSAEALISKGMPTADAVEVVAAVRDLDTEANLPLLVTHERGGVTAWSLLPEYLTA